MLLGCVVPSCRSDPGLRRRSSAGLAELRRWHRVNVGAGSQEELAGGVTRVIDLLEALPEASLRKGQFVSLICSGGF